MPSLRKRVSSYLRQLSFHNEPREKHLNFIENTFINKYLQGEIKVKDGPTIHNGKMPPDLPSFELAAYKTGPETIIGCFTGPDGGLTAVKRKEKHLSLGEQDIDFIDTADDSSEIEATSQPIKPIEIDKHRKAGTLDNTTMVIRMAGQEYLVTNRKKSKSHSLGSLNDFDGTGRAVRIEIDKTKRLNNNNEAVHDQNSNHSELAAIATKIDKEQLKIDKEHEKTDEESTSSPSRIKFSDIDNDNTRKSDDNCNQSGIQGNYSVGKSKSDGNPFRHEQRRKIPKSREGRIRQLAERPTAAAGTSHPSTVDPQTGQRIDPHLPSTWNRKSELVYGISDSLYDKNLTTRVRNGHPIADCFGIITRADSAILAVADGVNWGEKAAIAAKSAVHGCLHYLNKTIFLDTRPFENLSKAAVAAGGGAGSEGKSKETPIHETRTANTRDIFIALLRAFNCAHDLILENEGMLTTLTVAVVLPLKDVAGVNRDGASVVCVCNVGDSLAYVYSEAHGVRELTKGSHDITANRDMRDALGALGPVDGIKPELSNLTLSLTCVGHGDIVMLASDGLTDNFDPTVCKFAANAEMPKVRKTSSTNAAPQKPPRKNAATGGTTSGGKVKPPRPKSEVGDNPLVAQFLKDNPISKSASTSTANAHAHSLRTSSTRGFALLRSKTALDFRANKQIARSPDGLPYITPTQRYEITLLMIEDVLKKGITGKECRTVTARRLCDNLLAFTMSITNAKRRTLEDNDLYFDNRNGVLVQISAGERKMRRKRALEKVQNLPGKLDHVTVVACNVGNRCYSHV